MKNRIISIITAIVIVCSSLSISNNVAADDSSNVVAGGQYGENIYWSLDDKGVLTLSGEGEMLANNGGIYSSNLPWIEYRGEIQKLVVKEGITSIAGYAFAGCKVLDEVKLPESLTSIGYEAFGYTRALKSINIPTSVENIEGFAFGYTGLRYITIPEKVDEIKKNLFTNSDVVKVTVLNNNIKAVGDKAFERCYELREVDFHGSVENVGENAFEECTKLNSFGNLTYMKNIGKSAFRECHLNVIKHIKGMENIGDDAFSCGIKGDETKYIILPDTVKSIGQDAFFLTGATICVHDTVESIVHEYDEFFATDFAMILDSDTIIYDDEIRKADGTRVSAFYKDKYVATEDISVTNVSGKTIKINDVSLSNNQSINVDAICTDVPDQGEEPYIEKTEGEAGSHTTWKFDKDSKTLTFYGERVEAWDVNYYVNEVEHIVFAPGVGCVSSFSESSNNTAFTNVIDVTIPESMAEFSPSIVSYCKNLKEYKVGEYSYAYKSIDGNLYSKYDYDDNKFTLIRYAIGKTDTSYTVAEGTRLISSSAFYNDKNVKELVLAESVTEVQLPMYKSAIEKIIVNNPDCKVTKSGDSDVVICCYANSTTEEYCIKNRVKYEYIGIEPVNSIDIIKKPNQLNFFQNERINANGMEVKVVKQDGSEEIVTTGFTVTCDTSILGKRDVIVEYGGATATYQIDSVEIPQDRIIDLTKTVSVSLQEGEDSEYLFFTPLLDGNYEFKSSSAPAAIAFTLKDFEGYQYTKSNTYISAVGFDVTDLKAGKQYIIKLEKKSGKEYSTNIEVNLHGTKENHEHNYNVIISKGEPTCTAMGYTEYACPMCGKKIIDNDVEKLPHQFVYIYEIAKETCVSKAHTIYKCKDCDEKNTVEEGSFAEHKYIYTVIEPTDTDYGYTIVECKVCGESKKCDWVEPKGLSNIINGREDITTNQSNESKDNSVDKNNAQSPKIKLKQPKVKASRRGKKLTLRMSSKDKKVSYLIYIKKNGKYKRIKVTKSNKYSFVNKKKCIIKVRTMKKIKGKKYYSTYKKISV